MIFLPKIKAADSAHKGILPSDTRPFSVFWRGPGYETTTVHGPVCEASRPRDAPQSVILGFQYLVK